MQARREPALTMEALVEQQRVFGVADGIELLLRLPHDMLQNEAALKKAEKDLNDDELKVEYEDFISDYQ